jgi:hypothetical protein
MTHEIASSKHSHLKGNLNVDSRLDIVDVSLQVGNVLVNALEQEIEALKDIDVVLLEV